MPRVAAVAAVAAALLLPLVSSLPQAAPTSATAAPTSTGAATGPEATFEPSNTGDQATDFVADLIANLTIIAEEQGEALTKRGLTCSGSSLTVNTLNARYQGVYDASTGLNTWRGIRYATPPTGNLRWQPPIPPLPVLNPPVVPAATFGPACPQTFPAGIPGPGLIPGNEDCLFLNVYAKPNAQNLPVMIYIHGGGFNLGDGTQGMDEIINANNKGFIAVTIQYRLGAFGFLSSQEVKNRGVVNAGLLDQALAITWVKAFICQFGGDPTSITIAGESAGGASVMYHDMAVNGGLGDLLFDRSIAASPSVPFQYPYNSNWATTRYYRFSQAAGCPSSGNVFDCIRSKDTVTLQQANFATTQQEAFGYWGFFPVTDGVYVVNTPTSQLGAKRVNGNAALVGHNANEGPLFIPRNIVTQADLVAWLHVEFPNLSNAQINQILAANPNSANTNPAGPRYETNGLTGATAVEVSQDSNGQQQRGNNIFAEATFVCPAYWLSSAFTAKDTWHYQYSVPFALHGSDISAYFGPATPNQSDDFVLAFRRIWGNFIIGGNPRISNPLANGASSPNPNAPNGASTWPEWTDSSPKMLNLNETGGTPYTAITLYGLPVTQYMQPGLRNALAVVPADTWEGGRGSRCALYKSLGPSIPV